MKTSTKFLLTAAVLGTLGLGGIARTVYASQSKPAVAIVPQHRTSIQIAEASDGDGEANDATEVPEAAPPHQYYTMAKTEVAQREASDSDGEVDDDAEEQQEAAKLQPLVKITSQQAQQAAEAAQGGTASSVKLENEDGNLVYEVTIGQTEVIVDAGDGKVLYTENVNQQEDEATLASRPRSSIQVPNTDAEDKEVNNDGSLQQRR